MKVHGNYDTDGYAYLERLVPREIAEALLNQFWRDLISGKLPTNFNLNAVLSKPAMELNGANFPAITTFLWGLLLPYPNSLNANFFQATRSSGCTRRALSFVSIRIVEHASTVSHSPWDIATGRHGASILDMTKCNPRQASVRISGTSLSPRLKCSRVTAFCTEAHDVATDALPPTPTNGRHIFSCTGWIARAGIANTHLKAWTLHPARADAVQKRPDRRSVPRRS